MTNIKFSDVVLLTIFGFLIYYLTKPSTSESFESLQEANPLLGKNTILRPPAQLNEVVGLFDAAKKSREVVTPTVPSASYVPDVKPELVQQILNEAKPESSKCNPTGVFNFEPTDDNYDTAADLDQAFTRPIPQQMECDAVSINKNNVLNYDSKDFLPKEVNDEWFNTDFSQATHSMNDDKLINTERYVIGVNTVGQSLKNASYDIRGTVANPKFTVSPWNNSTYEPDFNIKPL
jgi:hypothetical protein